MLTSIARWLPARANGSRRARCDDRACGGLLAVALVCGVAAADASAQTVTLSVPLGTSLAEGGGSTDVVVTATLSTARTSETSVTLSLAGTARNSDYSVAPSTLPTITIAAGSTTGTANLVVSVVDDAHYEGTETLYIGGAAGDLEVSGATVNVGDNDSAPTLVMTTVSISLAEGGSGQATVAIRLSTGGTFEEDVTVSLVEAERSSVEETDYSISPALPAEVTLAAGTRTASMEFQISVTEDSLAESSEHLDVRAETTFLEMKFSSDAGRILNIVGSGPERPESDVSEWVSLFDDLVPAENATEVRLSVNRDPAARTDTRYTLRPDGNASWFTPSELTLTLPAGFGSVEGTFTVEPTEIDARTTVNIEMRHGTTLLDSSRLAVYPQQAPQFRSLRFSHVNYGTGSVDVEYYAPGARFVFVATFDRPFAHELGFLRLQLDSGPGDAACRQPQTYSTLASVSCSYSVAPGDYDYDQVIEVRQGALELQWVDELDSMVTWPVPTMPSSDLRVSIDKPIYGGRHGFELAATPQSSQEGGGATAVTITAVRLVGLGASEPAVSVPLVFRDRTTSAGDYTVTGTLQIDMPENQREASTTVMVTPVEDFVKEDRVEEVRIEAGSGDPSVWAPGIPFRIIDAPHVALSVSPTSIDEDGGAQEVTVTAALGDATDSVRPRAIPVTLTLGGTAGAGDYVVAETLEVTIPANARSGSATLTVTPVDDRLQEMDETIVVDGSTLGLTVVGTELTLADDDMQPHVILAVDPNALSEGDSATDVTVTATLDASVMVSDDIVVTLDLGGTATGGSSGDYAAAWSPASKQITIPAGQDAGSSAVTLTRTPRQDTLAEGDETIVVEGTAQVSNTAMEALSVVVAAVTLTDDDMPGVQVTPMALEVDEGGSGTYAVALASQPTADVRVGLTTPLAGTDLSVSPEILTFTTANWSTAQTVTVSAAEDDDAADDAAVTLEHTATGGGYDAVPVPDVSVTIDENDRVGLVLSTTSLAVDEGDAAGYTVALALQPTATVNVSVAGASGTDLSLDATSLTFTTANWSTAQTVTVSAAEDADAVDDTATLTHTASGGDYGSVTGIVTVTVDDDETAGLVLPKASLNPEEGGSESYTVALGSEPTAEVTVTIGGASGTDLSLNATSLTFTTANWSTAQTVTVSAGQDADAVDDEATLTHTASGGDYGSVIGIVTVTVDDDETADLVLSTTSLEPEEGGSESYTVALATQPTVTVAVTIGGTAGTELSLSPSSVTFTTTNWSTAQSVTVSAGQDADAVDDEATLTHTASGGHYGSVTGIVTVTVDDDETADLVLSTTSLNPSEGGSESYTVRLSSQPTAEVTVTVGGTAGTDLSLDRSSLTFTTATWNTVQSVTVSAGQDGDAIDDEATLTHTASGGDYGSASKSVSVTVDDDETVDLVLSKTSLNPSEGDGESYTVRLGSQPTATVMVTIGGTSGTDLTLDKSSLTFTTATWNTVQSVTVTAGQDADAVDDTATLTHTASGGDYGSVTGIVSVTVDDDETVDLVLSKASLNPPEGEGESYTVKLGSQPTAAVTVSIGGASGTDLTLDKSSLTFTTTTWSTAQTVTVSAAQDADAVDDTATLAHTASGGGYGSATGSVTVTVADDETAELVLSKASLNPSEGGSESYTVALGSEPTARVTVSIGGTSGTDLSLDKSVLTFTTTTWNTVQSVTVTAGDDGDAVDDTATLTHTASGGDYGSVTGSVSVTVDDDETVELVLSKTSLNPEEGSSEGYTVRLGSEPTAAVTVTISGTSGTDLSLDKSALTFTTTSWSTVQSVTVTAGQDGDAVDDTATLAHAASGGGYGSVTRSVSVTVADDETAELLLSKTSLNPEEGDGESYTVALGSEPTARVTVSISGTAGTDLSLDKSVLTFTTTSWSTVQSVTVTAGQDADAVDDTATLAHAASGGDYGSVTRSVSVTVADDETAELLLSKASLNPAEGGSESYTVKLGSQPTARVTVSIGGTSGTELSLDKPVLTFTTTTWNTVQSVTVTAGDDGDAVDDTATLTHTASGGDYGSVTGSVSVTVDDDETVELLLSKASLNPPEGGSESYTVALGSEPTARVTVSISGTAGTELSLDKSVLTFTTTSWSTVQSVTVSAGQDDDAVNDTATLAHTASGGGYGSVTGSVSVTVADDETAELVPSPTSLPVVEGGEASYTVKLGSAPTAPVTVTIGGVSGTDLSLDKSSLTFTAATWSTAQSVTVTAGQDDDAVNDTATLTHTASGGDYGSVTKSVPVTVTDNESAGLALSKTSLNPSEGDGESYTVRLSSQPTAPVTVTIGGVSGTDLSLDKSSLTFTTASWSTVQSVTVSAGQDADAVNDTATLTHTASGGDYGSVTRSVSVTVADDETAELVLSKTSLNPSEGGSESYTVALGSAPTAPVTVTVGGVSGTDLSLDRSSLTFTAATWSTVQSVTVTAGQDADAVDDTATLTHTASGGDYGSVTGSVSVTVADDETADLVLSKASLNPSEGGSESYTVKLESQPSASVTVSISGTSGTDLSLNKSVLTFTTASWSTVQSVTVTAGQDARRGGRRGDADARGVGRELRVGDGERVGDGCRRRDGGSGAVEGVVESVGGRQRELHGEAGVAAVGPGDGEHLGRLGDGPVAERDEPDVHDDELVDGAVGDGDGGPGRRRGGRRGDADAHGVGGRLRVGDGERDSDGCRRRDGGPGVVGACRRRGRGRQRELHGEAVVAADGFGDGDHQRHVGNGPVSGQVGPDVHDDELVDGAVGDGDGGPGRRRGGRRGDADAHGVGGRLRLGVGARVGDGRRRRDGGPGAVADVGDRGRGRRGELHGEAGLGADGGGDGDHRRHVGDGPVGGRDEPDVHDDELVDGADGDGDGGPGRRRGGRRGDADAHGVGWRLRLGVGERVGDGCRRRDGGSGAVADVSRRQRRGGGELHAEAVDAADGGGDGDHRRHVGDGPVGGRDEPDVHDDELVDGADGDGDGG